MTPNRTRIFATVACLLAMALGSTSNVHAQTDKPSTPDETEQEVQEKAHDQAEEKRKKIVKEATSAIRETENALKSLDEGKNEEALAALERATGKLEIILAREPDLALAPSGMDVVTYDVLGSVDSVKKLTEDAEEKLEDGRLQEARHLIRDLASEIVISVSNIPLATYPDAIKRAAKLIDDGKADDAKRVLQTALNTLVVTDSIIPLPVMIAEQLLKDAEPLAEKSDRTDEEIKKIADLLKKARAELKFAEALGYGSKKDFKNLYEQLDMIEEKTERGESGKGFFAKIKGYLKDAVGSSQSK